MDRRFFYSQDILPLTAPIEPIADFDLDDLVRSYLTTMLNQIEEFSCSQTDTQGNAINASWELCAGATEIAQMVCRCAFASLRACVRFNEKWVTRGVPNLEIAIGISVGDAPVRVGPSELCQGRRTADVLQAMNRKHKTHVLVSGDVAELITGKFMTRYVDALVVVGQAAPVVYHELVREL